MLRHGHASRVNLEKEQWHNADQVHRDDPGAHRREESFDPDKVRWSRNNSYLPWHEKCHLIEEAHYRHNGTALGEPPRSSTYPKPTLPDEAHDLEPDSEQNIWEARAQKMAEVDVELSPTPAPIESTGDEIIDMLAALPARVDKLENRADNTLQLLTSTRSDLSDLRGDVARINSKVADSEQGRKTFNEAFVVHVQAVDERISALEEAAARRIEITINNNGASTIFAGIQHERFPKLIKLVTSLKPEQRNIWLSGPAGSGKTSAARELAKHLGLPFKFHGAIGTPFQLTGYLNPVGKYVGTAFRDIYENGGVILLDECDGSSANALLELNAALANSHASFPDGMIARHEDCYVVAAANTWGFGGDGNYVGRARLDAAFLDRFITLSWPYDEVFESQLANNPTWVSVVHEVRRTAFQLGAQFVISPRASILGAQLLAAGNEPEDVVEAVFGRYRSDPMWPRIGKAAEDYAKASTSVTQSPTTAGNGAAKPGSLLGPIDFSKVHVYGLDK